MDDNGYFGKYRGIVTKTNDPKNLGRIKALVPDVFDEEECDWAWPCLPFGGTGLGFFAIPAKDAHVWIEFEGGDPECPIWTGCFWQDTNEMPEELQSPGWQSDENAKMKLLIKTKGGHSLLLDDSSDACGMTLKTSGGQTIVVTDNGIEISLGGSDANIKLNGSTVTINDDGLEVT